MTILTVTAFDAKEFPRSKFIESAEGRLERITFFYTPLGVGVEIPDEKKFVDKFVDSTQFLAKDFRLPFEKYLFSSTELKEFLGMRRAIPFCDKLIASVGELISTVFVSYIVRPPATYPFTEVGGYKSPTKQVKTEAFLRQLGPSFSYLTAWRYFGSTRAPSTVYIDGIGASKRTSAWDDLCPLKPKIFPYGDECNACITAADIVAFLTDVKLYGAKMKLRSENIQKVWEGQPFDVDVHYMDAGTESKYKWYSDEIIDIENYLARPMIFFIFDELSKSLPESVATDEKFSAMLSEMQPYHNIANFAFHRKGAFQKFDTLQDMKKVKDGDTIVYLGPKSKDIALAIGDMLNVDIVSVKDLAAVYRT